MAIYLISPHYSLSLHRRPDIIAGAPISKRRSKALLLRGLKTPAVFKIAAARRSIEGVSEELNAMASQSLDTAAARRRVRSAFLNAQERLDHFLFKAAPSGVRMEERYERNSKGMEIFWKSWLPNLGIATKATLFFCHGYGDTCTFFFEGIAKRIAAAGYGVYAMDFPGFGLSEGLHGYIPSFDELVDHVIDQYARIRERREVAGLRHFLLGQSMGGAVALKVHLKQPEEWDGVLLVAPMCKDYSKFPTNFTFIGIGGDQQNNEVKAIISTLQEVAVHFNEYVKRKTM